MNRPLKHLSDQMLQEHRIRAVDALASFNQDVHYRARNMHAHYDNYAISAMGASTHNDKYVGLDFEQYLRSAAHVALTVLEDDIDAIESELEWRELDADDAKDATGGVAA